MNILLYIAMFLSMPAPMQELSIKIKNGEQNYKFRHVGVEIHSIHHNIVPQDSTFTLEILNPGEEKILNLRYYFKKPFDDKIYLKIKEPNGKILYSNIYSLKYKTPENEEKGRDFDFYFSPNALIFYSTKGGVLKLNIFDAVGRKVFSEEKNTRKGFYKRDLSFLKPGIYFYHIEFNKQYSGKFVILKGGVR